MIRSRLTTFLIAACAAGAAWATPLDTLDARLVAAAPGAGIALAETMPGPAGAPVITIYLDDDVLEHFRALAKRYGTGYQTLINAALRSRLSGASGERGWFV
ncbi:MAG: BrnA antitoxin family protein [Telluria sp.]